MSDVALSPPVVEASASPVCSPPPSPQPPQSQPDAGLELLELSRRLMATGNRRLMLEYLRLRRRSR